MLKLSAVFMVLLLAALSIAVISARDNYFFSARELASPGDWLTEAQIRVYQHKVVLDIDDASWASFADTNSMDPLLDETANALEIYPKSPAQIKVGDVISYRSDASIIIHRVIAIREDEQGTYFVVKGDNNSFDDPAKVRFEQVVGVVVAIIY